MKPLVRSILLLSILVSPFLQRGIAADSQKWAFVASYEHSHELELTVGERVDSILRRNNIECLTITERGAREVTIGVPPNRASEARLLLAQATKAEKLQLTLLARLGVVVTPDSILKSKKD